MVVADCLGSFCSFIYLFIKFFSFGCLLRGEKIETSCPAAGLEPSLPVHTGTVPVNARGFWIFLSLFATELKYGRAVSYRGLNNHPLVIFECFLFDFASASLTMG